MMVRKLAQIVAQIHFRDSALPWGQKTKAPNLA